MHLRVPAVLLVAALALTGCRGGDPDDGLDAVPTGVPTRKAPVYDGAQEPARAVLALVPISAEVVTVTDFDQVRVQLGVPDLTSADPFQQSTDFWERTRTEAPLLAEGLLRADNSTFLLDYGFTQDDVDWEAHFTGPEGNGFVLAFRPGLELGPVAEAVADGAGPLAGATLLPDQGLVVSGTTEDGEPSWGSEPAWDPLVGEPAEATYLRRGCVRLTDALGPDADAEDQERLLTKHPVTNLDELAGFTVAFGDHNATVRVNHHRDDLFDRIDLGRDWPTPDFGRAFTTGVGDPATGRIGYDVPRPALAAGLTLLEELPFGVCPEVEPLAEPTG